MHAINRHKKDCSKAKRKAMKSANTARKLFIQVTYFTSDTIYTAKEDTLLHEKCYCRAIIKILKQNPLVYINRRAILVGKTSSKKLQLKKVVILIMSWH